MWVVNAGLATNLLLALLKTSIGILGHSAALLADGINSTSDVAYYIVVKIFMKLARKPADAEHPYGHSQLETIAALIVGSFVITTAVAIFWDAINRVYDILTANYTPLVINKMAFWVAILTVLLKIVLTYVTKRAGKQTGNAAILALAYDHRNDIFSAAGAAIGIYMGLSGHPWADPLVGAVVAVIVLRTGIEILRESSSNLMDAVPGEPLERQIREILARNPAVKDVEEIQSHRFGPYLVINVTIAIDGDISLAEGDAIATDVDRTLTAEIKMVRRVYVHYHPLGSPKSTHAPLATA